MDVVGPTYGGDVSSHQDPIDWPAVATAGWGFGWVKLTQGVGYVNPFYATDLAGLEGIGLLPGSYDYVQPSRDSAIASADFYLSNLGVLPSGYRVALDFEDPKARGDLSGWALTWLQRVEAALGFLPFLYSSQGYMQAHNLWGNPSIARYPLWLAAWQTNPPPPPWTIWQYSDSGQVAGIATVVDLDVFNGTRAQLAALGKP